MRVQPSPSRPPWLGRLWAPIMFLALAPGAAFAAQETPALPPPTAQVSPESGSVPDVQAYRNETLGFEVDYPTDWQIVELTGSGAEGTTSFTPPGQQTAGVLISVLQGAAESAAGQDLPHQRCQAMVTHNGLSGERCLSTLSAATSVTLSEPGGRQYVLSHPGGRMTTSPVFESMVESFRLVDGGAGVPAGSDPSLNPGTRFSDGEPTGPAARTAGQPPTLLGKRIPLPAGADEPGGPRPAAGP